MGQETRAEQSPVIDLLDNAPAFTAARRLLEERSRGHVVIDDPNSAERILVCSQSYYGEQSPENDTGFNNRDRAVIVVVAREATDLTEMLRATLPISRRVIDMFRFSSIGRIGLDENSMSSSSIAQIIRGVLRSGFMKVRGEFFIDDPLIALKAGRLVAEYIEGAKSAGLINDSL